MTRRSFCLEWATCIKQTYYIARCCDVAQLKLNLLEKSWTWNFKQTNKQKIQNLQNKTNFSVVVPCNWINVSQKIDSNFCWLVFSSRKITSQHIRTTCWNNMIGDCELNCSNCIDWDIAMNWPAPNQVSCSILQHPHTITERFM